MYQQLLLITDIIVIVCYNLLSLLQLLLLRVCDSVE